MYARSAMGGARGEPGLNAAIPPLSEPPNWGRLPIQENGEPLVAVTNGERLRARAQYAAMGIPNAPTIVCVRSGVRERLLRAARALPPGVELLVLDGFRPLSVQQFLYDHFWAETAAAHADLSEAEIARRVGEFVASPTGDPLRPPPHRTGGAVDLCLIDADGAQLPMGTAYDEAAPASAMRYFEEHPAEPFTTNRRLLFHAMTGAGFTAYRGEWWHFDYGNQRWANGAGMPHAFYGIAPEPPGAAKG